MKCVIQVSLVQLTGDITFPRFLHWYVVPTQNQHMYKLGLGTLCSKFKSLCYAPMLQEANHYAPCSDLLCSIKAIVEPTMALISRLPLSTLTLSRDVPLGPKS